MLNALRLSAPSPRRPAPSCPAPGRRSQAGVAMMELLLTVFILLIGLLGLAALQVKVSNANLESYQRAQALVLLDDMVEKFSSSRKIAGCFAFTTDSTNGRPYLGQPAAASDSNLKDVSTIAAVNCASGATGGTGVSSVDDRAQVELASWDRALKGVSETLSSAQVGAIQGARGCIASATSTDGTGMTVYTFAVAWQGAGPGVAPSNACATGTYGSDDTFRRVVWTTVRVATLI